MAGHGRFRAKSPGRIQERFGTPRALLLLGVLAPAAFHGAHLAACTPPVYLTLVTAATFLIGFGFNWSRGNVLVAIGLHGVMNASSAVFGDLVAGAALDLLLPGAWLVALGYVFVATLLAIVTRGGIGTLSGAERTALTRSRTGSAPPILHSSDLCPTDRKWPDYVE